MRAMLVETLPALTEPPPPGEAIEVAPGVLWARFWLPFRLNHVNVYLIDDGAGWIAIDTGIGIDDTRDAWEKLLAGPLRGRPLTRVLATHYHPDHMGLVGWLTRRFDIPLSMPRTEFLYSLAIQNSAIAANRPFYEERGLPAEAIDRLQSQGLGYLRLVTGLPTQNHRLVGGEALALGALACTVHTAGGHAPEQAMLHAPAAGLFFAADQVMLKISPNIAVQAMEPEGDPLGEFLASLAALRRTIPEDTLVLPGHHLPFTGLHARIAELAAHHESRCALILEACRERPMTATELVPVVFRRDLDPHQLSFAFSEVVAHINYMRGLGELVQERFPDGILRVGA